MPRRSKPRVRQESRQVLPIDVPQFQNWNCHNCTFCCRDNMSVEVSLEEKQRIEGQGWSSADGVDPDRIFVATDTGSRLGHQADGACVFLNASGRCRIHERFGEVAKPLPCRLFPFAIHPAGDRLTVSLRFGCPSVAANRGRGLSEHRDAIRQLAQEVVPVDYREGRPPELMDLVPVTWPVLRRCVDWLDAAVADPSLPIALKLLRVFACLRAMEIARSHPLVAQDPVQLLGMLSKKVAEKLPSIPEPAQRPTRFGHFMFRVLLFEYARTESASNRRRSRSRPLLTLASLLGFATTNGRIPRLRPEWGELRFDDLERPFGELPVEAESTLTRFFRVKIQGLHFCGRAQHDVSFAEGFYGLALLLPVILWLSRNMAASHGRKSIAAEDVSRAMMIADHHYGYSKRLRSYSFRKIVQLLAQREDVGHLCGWYGK